MCNYLDEMCCICKSLILPTPHSPLPTPYSPLPTPLTFVAHYGA
ncbi:hypothetical protein NSP_19870 [Nodularia spumigena CCY9414]|nr:hypothetical protein NSP_19870 [Nodularia spumigena CCY9414]